MNPVDRSHEMEKENRLQESLHAQWERKWHGRKYETLDYELEVAKTFVDMTYGRPLKSRQARRMIKEFTWKKFLRPAVSERPNDRYAILDGQHRIHAAEKNGHALFPCIVYFGLTVEEEAMLFVDLNKERVNPNSLETFKAALRGREETALALKALLDKHKIKVGKTNDKISCIALLRRIYHMSPVLLDATMETVTKAWGGLIYPNAYNAIIISGIHSLLCLSAVLVSRNKKIKLDTDRLIEKMQEHQPQEFLNKVNSFKALGITGSRLAGSNYSESYAVNYNQVAVSILLEWYNHRLRGAARIEQDVLPMSDLMKHRKEIVQFLAERVENAN